MRMLSTWWLDSLTYLQMAGLASILCLMLRRKMLRAWPSLFAALAFELAIDIRLQMLIGQPHGYRKYFIYYWSAAGVHALLRLWILSDVIRSFPGLEFLRVQLYIFFSAITATITAASAYTCRNVSFTKELQNTAIKINDCVTIAWIVIAVVLLSTTRLFNFGWSAAGAYIANGIFIKTCGSAVVAKLIEYHHKPTRFFAQGLDSAVTIAVLFSWVYVFSRPIPFERVHDHDTPCPS